MGKLPVHAGLDRRGEVVQGASVGHDVSPEPPAIAQRGVEQFRVRAGGNPVQPVVGAHDRCRLGIPDGHLERQQIELVQRAWRDHGVSDSPRGFLFVAGEVLRHRVDAVVPGCP